MSFGETDVVPCYRNLKSSSCPVMPSSVSSDDHRRGPADPARLKSAADRAGCPSFLMALHRRNLFDLTTNRFNRIDFVPPRCGGARRNLALEIGGR